MNYLSPHFDSRRRHALVAIALTICCALAAGGCVNGESASPLRNTSASPNSDVTGAAARKNLRVATTSKPATGTAGAVLIAGGVGPSMSTLASAEYFDPSTSNFVATGSAATSRAGASAAPLSTAESAAAVLLDGGFSGTAAIKHFSLGLDGNVLASAEVFDGVAGSFSPAGAMLTPRL
ncbi:MAG TPA: hypothetical protein VET85_10220, partial [Stellaceae bacterium]|nr:hypothetical protein [Stellaceae bacterium]